MVLSEQAAKVCWSLVESKSLASRGAKALGLGSPVLLQRVRLPCIRALTALKPLPLILYAPALSQKSDLPRASIHCADLWHHHIVIITYSILPDLCPCIRIRDSPNPHITPDFQKFRFQASAWFFPRHSNYLNAWYRPMSVRFTRWPRVRPCTSLVLANLKHRGSLLG